MEMRDFFAHTDTPQLHESLTPHSLARPHAHQSTPGPHTSHAPNRCVVCSSRSRHETSREDAQPPHQWARGRAPHTTLTPSRVRGTILDGSTLTHALTHRSQLGHQATCVVPLPARAHSVSLSERDGKGFLISPESNLRLSRTGVSAKASEVD